jgi:hypothetical protein
MGMRYILHKRLKFPHQIEISERRQVGDVEDAVKQSDPGTGAFRDRDSDL